MTSSSGLFSDPDSSRVELPVFLSPPELLFAPTKRRSSLTVYNPYQNDVQFRILTTSPERYDVGVTKGTIKPGRRIDITIRLLSNAIQDLPDPSEISQAIDYFRISIQYGQLKGNRSVEVHWSLNSDQSNADEGILGAEDERATRFRAKVPKPPSTTQPARQTSTSTLTSHNTRSLSTRPSAIRSTRQTNQFDGSSNVNLVCTLCTVVCVITLFLPLSMDSDFCKRVKLETQELSTGIIANLSRLFSVSYEVKLGCSFALGLFTYRLISTLPD